MSPERRGKARKEIDPTIPKTFGVFLREKRAESGISLEILGQRTGVSASYISKLESGHIKEPGASFVLKAALTFGITEIADIIPYFVNPIDLEIESKTKKLPIEYQSFFKNMNNDPGKKQVVLKLINQILASQPTTTDNTTLENK